MFAKVRAVIIMLGLGMPSELSLPLIKLVQVKKIYPLGETNIEALKGVNLECKRGEFSAIIGASGSGKSTLLNIIGTIDDASSGEVYIEGVHINKLNDVDKTRLRNEKIGFIFQTFNLIPVLNVYENIELPLLLNKSLTKKDREERVLAILEEVSLQTYSKHRPDQLSGGQRQRVAIARALAPHPSLVLADEPTANLDSKTSQKIVELMQNLNQKHKVTFLFSTHDEKLMTQMHRTIPIKDGLIQDA